MVAQVGFSAAVVQEGYFPLGLVGFFVENAVCPGWDSLLLRGVVVVRVVVVFVGGLEV